MNLLKTMTVLAAGLIGASASATPMTAIVRLKAKVTMAELAKMVSDPASPRYQNYFTPAEIRALSAPSDAEYATQLQELRNDGFQIVSDSKTHLWVSVRADHTHFENMFLTQLRDVQNGRHQLMATPRIPSHWNLVEGITGLDSSSSRHPRHVVQMADPKAGSLATPPTQGVLPQQIKTIYGFDSIYSGGINGAGQHIAVATYNDVNLTDIQTYYANIALNPTPSVDRMLFNGTPTVDENSAIETSLDAEFSGMIAPGASVHVFTSATNDDAGETAMFTAILDDNRAKVVNYSWGECEKSITPAHMQEMTAIFQRAVAQGVNLMVASGDSGSASCQNDTSVQADWPGAVPYIVSVGGTSLAINGNTAVETAWGPCDANSGAGCSGGGISTLWALPDYQKNLPAPYAKRSYPDVSFNADNVASGEPVWATYGGQAQWLVIGGTSMAAPQWSGFMALVGQARQKAGKATLGFLNPIIYAMTSAQQAMVFTDITSGSNGAYTAGPGWDAVTGLGSPKAAALFNALSTQ